MSSSAPSPPAGAPPPPPPPAPEFFCYGCHTTVSVSVPTESRPLCPLCHSRFIEESPSTPSPPSPPPPPPALLLSLSSSSSPSSPSSSSSSDDDGGGGDGDDLDFVTDPSSARAYLRRLVHRHRLQSDNVADGGPLDVAAAAALSVLQQQQQHGYQYHHHRAPVHGPRRGPGGEPPATAASIAALPTVAVAEPASACAICKDDLPLASEARKLPCAHLYHSCCIVTWLQLHNSCPVCRFRIPSDDSPSSPSADAALVELEQEQDPQPTTRITIRFTTTARPRRRPVRVGGGADAAPVSASPTQLAQAVTAGDGGAGGPANSGETVSSEWPHPHPENDTVMSEAREGDAAFFD